ncbi:MAG TPA: hypothetical protein VGM32_13125 [Rhodopila sp.]
MEDSRLVVLNARAAADLGATIAPRTACVSAERVGDRWAVALDDMASGGRRTVLARAPVNAA